MALAGSPRRPQDAADGLRLPPHSVEAEQAVLGGLMLDATAWDGVADLIEARDFYRRDHQLIFEAIAGLVEARSPCDAVTVSEALSGKGIVDEVGGLAYLARLTRDTPSAANVRAYAGIVRDYGLLRQLVNAGGEIAAMALDTRGRAPGELVEEAERRVFEIAERGTRTRAGFQTVRDILPRTIDRIDMLHQNPGAFTGVATGYTELDKLTVGLQPGDLVIIAGRPSMGKTTLAVNIAENAAIERKVPAAIFSMEMSAEALTLRMISSLGRVSQSHLRTGALSAEDWPRITSATEVLSQAPIYVDETPSLTPTEIRARARRLKREKGLGLIVVDYLQLMQVPGTRENRATEISEISRSLKALAKELQLPVIALSQLNRSVEQRVEKKPVMSDLRECVTGDTLVCLTDGRRVPIRDLVGQTPRVWAMDGHQKLVAAQSDLVWSVGMKPIFRVSLASGRSIRATAKHRLYSGRGWRTVRELATHDHLATTRRIPAPEAPALTADPKIVLLADVQAARGGRAAPAAQPAGRPASRRIGYLQSTAGGATSLALAANPTADQRREWSEPNLLWDRIVAIEPAGEEEVFDLTVPGPANWLADGIVSHNSGAIEQDADLILLIYREEVYEPNTPRKGIADIIIAKQRNGPTGEVHLTFLGEFTRFENLVAESYGEGVFR
jgi:replicative DNA helicase